MTPTEQAPEVSRDLPAPNPTFRPNGFRRWLTRIAVAVVLAFAVGRLAGLAQWADKQMTTPPGFSRGLLHGALMPLAWPALLGGADQSIYSERNSGRTYKLGYSLGGNVCGAVFFGWCFWRFNRWRRQRKL